MKIVVVLFLIFGMVLIGVAVILLAAALCNCKDQDNWSAGMNKTKSNSDE